jgi:hypothetical protein
MLPIVTTGEAAPVLIKAGLDDAIPLPDWSPPGKWIACGTLLISPDGKNERSLGTPRSLHYVFSKGGKLLYGMRTGEWPGDVILGGHRDWHRAPGWTEPHLPP